MVNNDIWQKQSYIALLGNMIHETEFIFIYVNILMAIACYLLLNIRQLYGLLIISARLALFQYQPLASRGI